MTATMIETGSMVAENDGAENKELQTALAAQFLSR